MIGRASVSTISDTRLPEWYLGYLRDQAAEALSMTGITEYARGVDVPPELPTGVVLAAAAVGLVVKNPKVSRRGLMGLFQ